MLLGIYLGTTLYTFHSIKKIVKKIEEGLEQDGLEWKENYSWFEKFCYMFEKTEFPKARKVLVILLSIVPLFQLLLPLVSGNSFTGDEYEYIKNILIENGAIESSEDIVKKTTKKEPEVHYIKVTMKNSPKKKKKKVVVKGKGNTTRVYTFNSSDTDRLVDNADEILMAIKNIKTRGDIDYGLDKKVLAKIMKKTTKQISRLNDDVQELVDDRILYPLMEQHYEEDKNNEPEVGLRHIKM